MENVETSRGRAELTHYNFTRIKVIKKYYPWHNKMLPSPLHVSSRWLSGFALFICLCSIRVRFDYSKWVEMEMVIAAAAKKRWYQRKRLFKRFWALLNACRQWQCRFMKPWARFWPRIFVLLTLCLHIQLLSRFIFITRKALFFSLFTWHD